MPTLLARCAPSSSVLRLLPVPARHACQAGEQQTHQHNIALDGSLTSRLAVCCP